jgi:hypothetical protein
LADDKGQISGGVEPGVDRPGVISTLAITGQPEATPQTVRGGAVA